MTAIRIFLFCLTFSLGAVFSVQTAKGGNSAFPPLENDSTVNTSKDARDRYMEVLRQRARAYRTNADSMAKLLEIYQQRAKNRKSSTLEKERIMAHFDSLYKQIDAAADKLKRKDYYDNYKKMLQESAQRWLEAIEHSQETAKLLEENDEEFLAELTRSEGLWRSEATRVEAELARIEELRKDDFLELENIPHCDFSKFKYDPTLRYWYLDPSVFGINMNDNMGLDNITKGFRKLSGTLYITARNADGTKKVAEELRRLLGNGELKCTMEVNNDMGSIYTFVRHNITSPEYSELIFGHISNSGNAEENFIIQLLGDLKMEEIEKFYNSFFSNK